MEEYAYELPPDRIARYPVRRRADSRLMVVRRAEDAIEHLRFRDLPSLARAGDLVMVNDTRVIPARLIGAKPTGARAEVLLLRRLGGTSRGSPTPDDAKAGAAGDRPGRRWEALVRPGRKLRPGRVVRVADDLAVHILAALPDGRRVVRLETNGIDPMDAVRRHGRVPLPPYLGRRDEPVDRDRYQTVYARHEGSAAAPTAGLHFTRAVLDDLAARGADVRALTLHVGTATFRPVEVDDPERHRMEAELYNVPGEVAKAYARCREGGGRVWAVGTTVARTLESVAVGRRAIRPGSGATDLFIRPPFDFRCTDCLITNFHLPRSTLIMLVAALAGAPLVRRAYAEAVARGYRFYSYGDAMALLP